MRTPFSVLPGRHPASLLLLMIVGGSALFGQVSGLEVGVGGGMMIGQGIGAIAVYPGSADCGEYSSPTIKGFQMDGVLLDRNLFGERSGLLLRLGYRDQSWDAATPAIDPLVVQSRTNGEILRIGRDYHFVLQEKFVEGSAFWRGGLPGSIGLNAGLGLGYRLHGSVQRTERINDGIDYRFDSGFVERPLVGSEPVNLSTLRFTFQIGIDHHVQLKGLALLPSVRVAYDPLGPEDQGRFSAVDLTIGAALLFSTSSAMEPPPSPPPIAHVDTTRNSSASNVAEPKPTHLTASVEVYGLDEENHRLPAATVTIYETITRLRGSLPRRIIFDGESFPTGGVDSRKEADGFVPDSLATVAQGDLDSHVLPLLGDIMRRADGARLRLIGRYRGSDGAPAALRRARSVMHHLADLWGIATDRMETTTARRREGENDVLLKIIPEAIEGRLDLEHHARTVVPPLLAVDHEYGSDAGIKRWRIELFHGTRRVGLFSSDGNQSMDSALGWDIPANEASIRRSSLVAELTVEDSAGTTAKTRAPTPLIIDRPCRVILRTLGENGVLRGVIQSLFPFADGSAQIDLENRKAIEQFVEDLGDRRTIRILLDSERGMGRRMTEERGNAVRRTVVDELKRRKIHNANVAIVNVERNANPVEHDLPEGTRGSFELLLQSE